MQRDGLGGMLVPDSPYGNGIGAGRLEAGCPEDAQCGETIRRLVEPPAYGYPVEQPSALSQRAEALVHLVAQLQAPVPARSCSVPDHCQVIACYAGCVDIWVSAGEKS